MANDLFSNARKDQSYTAKDIEVLEGLEPVRRRPGMYIGGTDERALHHLVAEVLDNAMDEAVAGHATWIEVELEADGYVTVRDNGRGIPIDPHPKFQNKSALEVILTTLHSGGKFSDKVYDTSGGLHGVGISVVNALSDELVVEVARDRKLWTQNYFARQAEGTKLQDAGRGQQPARHHRALPSRPGDFRQEPRISARRPSSGWRAPRRICSGASRSAGPATRRCSRATTTMPAEAVFHFPGGLKDCAAESHRQAPGLHRPALLRRGEAPGRTRAASNGRSPGRPTRTARRIPTCNTVPTPQGGSHEAGLRIGAVRAASRPMASSPATAAPRRSPPRT